MAVSNRFNFVGSASFPKADSKRPFFKEFEKNKKKMASMNFGIKESDNNMSFVEIFDSVQSEIKTKSADGEDIVIKWADRFDEDSIKSVANYKKFTIDLGEDFGGRQDFISTYDAILFLNEWFPKYKGKVMITGQFVKEFYKGEYYNKFKVNNVYAVSDDVKNKLSLSIDIYYNKDSIDKSDFKTDKKIYLNGYINQYIDKETGSKYMPQQLIFNASKYDIENNEKHKKLFDYKMQYLDIKNKTMQHIVWETRLVRGAEGVEWNIDLLTPKQKEQVELGIKTVDDFKPKGKILGDKINEIRLFDPQLTGDFTDGLVDTELSVKEFEDLIYTPIVDENIEEVINKTEAKSTEKKIENVEEKSDVEEEDLF